MCINTDILEYAGLPRYLSKSEILRDWICALSYASQKKLWACNDKIAQKSAKQFADMNLLENLTPAILAYDGIQYTTMSPDVFEKRHITYILSGSFCDCFCPGEKQLEKPRRQSFCLAWIHIHEQFLL